MSGRLLDQDFLGGVNRLAGWLLGQVQRAFLTTASQKKQDEKRSDGSLHGRTPVDEQMMKTSIPSKTVRRIRRDSQVFAGIPAGAGIPEGDLQAGKGAGRVAG